MSHSLVSAQPQGAWIAVGCVELGSSEQEIEHIPLDKLLLNHLLRFQLHSGANSLSEAVSQILLEYFEATTVGEDDVAQPRPLHSLLAQIQADQQQLFRTVTTLQQTITVLMLQMQPSSTATTKQQVPPTRPAAATATGSLKPAVYEKGLSGTDLAKRLGASSATISKRRSRSDFSAWTQMQDPDHLAWKFFSSTRRFHPVTLAFSAAEGS